MKTSLFVFLCFLGTCFAGRTEQVQIRQPLKPEWCMDVTNLCIRGDGLAMQQILDRSRRAKIDESGRSFSYQLDFELAGERGKDGIILEFDQGRIIRNLECGGKKYSLKKTRPFWDGTERGCLLPPGKKQRSAAGRERENKTTCRNFLSGKLLSGE